MIENILFSRTMRLMEKGLDAASLRNGVIANNLANVDTPGFKRSEVLFEDELKKAMNGGGRLTGVLTHERHIPLGGSTTDQVAAKVVKRNDTSMRNDGNNVDIDREMAAMAKNSIIYSALAQELNGDFQKLRTAIHEGRK